MNVKQNGWLEILLGHWLSGCLVGYMIHLLAYWRDIWLYSQLACYFDDWLIECGSLNG